MLVSSKYRITELHYTYGNATLSAAYVGYLYFQNHWVTAYYGCPTLRIAYVGKLYLKNHLGTVHVRVRHVK